MHKIELFRVAAVLAQDPDHFESMPELSEEDKATIRREKTRECFYFIHFFEHGLTLSTLLRSVESDEGSI